jgi:DNA-binding MarR family transcriptional regulator
MAPQTMIRIVENLETLRLIRREPHPTHGRVLMASLTPAGASAVTACHALVNGVERQMLRGLSSRERATLRDLLLRCLDGMGSDES